MTNEQPRWHPPGGPPPPGGWQGAVPPGGHRPGQSPTPPFPGPVTHVEPLPGTNFGLAYPRVTPTVSGLAVGSMAAGIAGLVVAVVMLCLGGAGANAGWGPLVAGAFAILAGLLGGAAFVAGLRARRQIRYPVNTVTGRGLALTGLICGAVTVGITALGFTLVAVLSR